MTTAMTGSAAEDIAPVARVQRQRPGADDARERAADITAVPLLGLAREVAEELAEALAPRAWLTEIAEDLAGHDPAAADPVRIGRRRSERMAGRGPRVEDREVDARADGELEASPEARVDLEQLAHLPLD